MDFLQWSTFLDSEGRVVDVKALRKRIFYGGVEHSLRKEVHRLYFDCIFFNKKNNYNLPFEWLSLKMCS